METAKNKLLRVFDLLLAHFGKQFWWPAETRFEVCVGAILTQATSWKNVEKAIDNLKSENLLTPEGIRIVNQKKLSRLIKPSLYHKTKAKKLKGFVGFLFEEYGGNIDRLLEVPKNELREELLGIWGIGPETADSIILYAAEKPSFVIDAYTVRILRRTGLYNGKQFKDFFENNLPEDVGFYQEYHALLVELGKNYCRKKPLCEGCPIGKKCLRQFNPRIED